MPRARVRRLGGRRRRGLGAYIDDLAASTVGAVLPEVLSAPPGDGGVSNVPAVVVVLIAMGLLLRGTSESARVNTAMVVLKVGVLLFFCGVAVTPFRAGNLAPFVPMGVAGVTAAASLLVCYDVAFPEAVRAHAVAGTGLLVVPTGPMDPYGHVGTVLVPARAYESQLFVADPNRTGAEGECVYCGAGCVIAPDGTELARAGRGEELLLAEGAPAVLTASPRVDPHLADRRPELYPTETPA